MRLLSHASVAVPTHGAGSSGGNCDHQSAALRRKNRRVAVDDLVRYTNDPSMECGDPFPRGAEDFLND